mgnify:FL=1
MSNLKQKETNPNEIFQTPFWANREGLDAMTSKINIDEAEAIMLFGQTYFKDHFPSKHPQLHTDMLAIMASKRKRKAIAVPRGHAKSTVVGFLLTLYRIVFQQRKFIVIVSDSEDKAKTFVMRIRSELEYNLKLARDFTQGGSFKSTDWAKTDFITSTGIRILAKGAGQSIRGELHLDTRPDMIVLDDIETDENAGKDEILNYMLTNVVPSVNRMGDYEICYVGTIIKDMSILHQMLINPEWASAKWEALDEEGEMLAPMLLPRSEYESSKRLYKSAGKMSLFYAENHNNPMVADDAQTFKKEYFEYYDELPDNLNYFIFYDPAMPPSGRTKIKRVDYSVLLVLATDSDQNWYVVRVIANRETPFNNRRLLYNLTQKYGTAEKPVLVQMETIAAQRGMYLEIKKEMKILGHKFPLREIPSHSSGKEARIEQLQPMYESGRIYHNKKDCDDLEQELLMFGRTPHDDRSDALSFAIGRVKYPKKKAVLKQTTMKDHWDKFLENSETKAWKTL